VNFEGGFEYLGVIFARSMVIVPEPERGKKKPPAEGIGEARDMYSTHRGVTLGQELIQAVREAKSLILKTQKQGTLDRQAACGTEGLDRQAACGTEGLDRQAACGTEIEDTSDIFMRTLYLQTQGSILRRQNERFIVSKDDQVISEILIRTFSKPMTSYIPRSRATHACFRTWLERNF